MNESTPTVLFVPASGPDGSGEYYRCLAIARVLRARDRTVAIHFVLNRHARVERDAQCHYHLIDDTPARARSQVAQAIDRLRPGLAVFDSSGRAGHAGQVRRLGGRVAWISDRPRQRRRGFRMRRMRHLDLHVIVDSGNPAPGPGMFERVKLAVFSTEAMWASTLCPPAESPGQDEHASLPAPGSGYAVFAAGGGGWHAGGRPVPEIFVDAAIAYHRQGARAAAVVLGPQYAGDLRSHPEVTVVPSLPTGRLGALLAGADLAVIGAGNMLSAQALAAGTPCVMVAVGGSDQPARVTDYSRRGIVLGSELEPEAMSTQALRLAGDRALARQLVAAARDSGFRDDTDRVARRLLALL